MVCVFALIILLFIPGETSLIILGVLMMIVLSFLLFPLSVILKSVIYYSISDYPHLDPDLTLHPNNQQSSVSYLDDPPPPPPFKG